ncbi:MAG TPA: hypothetical protein VGQ57_21175 [Polyangiaceae bacterium]|nr:hypothetical protein [Polyangiaceae bacterium]
MRAHRRSKPLVTGVVAAALCALNALVACDASRPVAPLRDGPAECAELEATCRVPAEALGESYRDCYQAGKSKISNACINYYDGCIDKCRAANEALGGGAGAAGAAGAAGESGHAG